MLLCVRHDLNVVFSAFVIIRISFLCVRHGHINEKLEPIGSLKPSHTDQKMQKKDAKQKPNGARCGLGPKFDQDASGLLRPRVPEPFLGILGGAILYEILENGI